MPSKPIASVGNEHPPFFPSSRIHSSGSHGPSEVVTYQIRSTSSQRIDSLCLWGCSQATSSFVIKSSNSQETLRFGSHGSKTATRKHRPKNHATNQPDALPSAIIHMPPTANRADTIRVKILITSAGVECNSSGGGALPEYGHLSESEQPGLPGSSLPLG